MGYLLAAMRPGYEVFDVADPVVPTVAELADLIGRACQAPAPRTVVHAAALVAAKAGDAIAATIAMDLPMTSRRLNTLTEENIFSVGK